MKAKVFNIQKFCLQDGPGIRTGVFFSGCGLNCRWCANPECRLPDEVSGAAEYEPGELLREVLKDKVFYDRSGGGVTLTGGELFTQYGFVCAFCRLLKENGVSVALETSGAVPLEKFMRVCGLADFVCIDCKHYDDMKHRAGTGVSNRRVLGNIAWLAGSGIPYCVRIPVIPEYNNSPQDAEGFARTLLPLGVRRVELLPFHQFGEGKYKRFGLPYPYAGVAQLHREDVAGFAAAMEKQGLEVLLK